MSVLKSICLAILLSGWFALPVAGQAVQGSDFQQRMTNALTSAKKSSDQLNEQHKSLLAAINKAADPQQAQRFLDGLIRSSSSALDSFGENSEMMKSVSNLMTFIDDRRKNAGRQASSDPRWLSRLDTWKAHADNVRQLRQDILREGDRAAAALAQLTKDRSIIEDIIASEGVAKAREEMQAALNNLKQLGDSLADAIRVAEERNNKIRGPSS